MLFLFDYVFIQWSGGILKIFEINSYFGLQKSYLLFRLCSFGQIF